MSFLNKYFWMPREAGNTNGEMSYDNSSRTEPKRAHQWLMDAPEPESFCNKKQAVEASNSRPMSGSSNANVSLWGNTSKFQSGSGLFPDQLLGPELGRTSNLSGKKKSSVVGAGDSNMERAGFKDSDKGMPVSRGLSYFSADNYANSFSTTNGNNLSLGPTYNDFIGNNYNKVDGSFTLMGQTIHKGNGSSMFMGRGHSKEGNINLPMRQPSLNGNGNLFPVDDQYVNGDDNIISMPPAYNKGYENLFAMGTSTAYSNANDNFIAMGSNFDKGGDNTIPGDPTTHNKVNTSVVLMGTAYEKRHSSIASTGLNYKTGESTTIPFGGSKDDPSATLKTDATGKNKEKRKSKKNPSNNFPTNVKSLLSTGILDGVPVKYISWARDKNLRGIIKEGAYNCGCNDCKFSKALNAYEFERHAGSKTKHPNNHIYFQNGKSIYAVVLELQNTPKEMLFEAIQSVTGSPVNQKNFSTWKASYEAATRELQRIYGKDGVVIRS